MYYKSIIFIIYIIIVNLFTTVCSCVLCLKRIPKMKTPFTSFHHIPPQLAPIHSKSSRQLYMTINNLENINIMNENQNNNDNNENNNEDDDEDDDMNKVLKDKMISAIKWYRSTLSPIMQPNCRFFPSCSNYAMQAIEEHGPWQGLILTAWRLVRCNPIGGSGYDPPMWPPPAFR